MRRKNCALLLNFRRSHIAPIAKQTPHRLADAKKSKGQRTKMRRATIKSIRASTTRGAHTHHHHRSRRALKIATKRRRCDAIRNRIYERSQRSAPKAKKSPLQQQTNRHREEKSNTHKLIIPSATHALRLRDRRQLLMRLGRRRLWSERRDGGRRGV